MEESGLRANSSAAEARRARRWRSTSMRGVAGGLGLGMVPSGECVDLDHTRRDPPRWAQPSTLGAATPTVGLRQHETHLSHLVGSLPLMNSQPPQDSFARAQPSIRAEAVDVLVVGAGPTGLTAACEALRHGLSVRIVDRKQGRSTHSKALVTHARTLEVFETMGVAAMGIEGRERHPAREHLGGHAHG